MIPKHSNTDVGWIKRKFAQIDQQLRESSAAKRLEAATIGRGGLSIKGGDVVVDSGGSIDVVGGSVAVFSGGSFYALWPDYSVAAYFGPHNTPNVQGISVGSDRHTDPDGFDTVFSAVRDSAAGTSNVYIGDSTAAVASFVIRAAQTFLVAPPTTSAAANVNVSGTGLLAQVTSSRRFKRDIEDAVVTPADVLAMRCRTWRDKNDVEQNPGTQRRYSGFIAEELDELPSLRQFVIYDAEDQPEAIAYDRLSVALIAVVQDQEKRLAALEAVAAQP